MNFNEKQSKEIAQFIIKYKAEEEFENDIKNLYDNEISKLSIIHIFALEEILRYGTKGVFNKFIEAKGTYTEAQAADLLDGFIKIFNNDENFKQYKLEQLEYSPETLSSIEMLAFELMGTQKVEENGEQEETVNKLEYDLLNPILYSNDDQTRETIANLFFGELIIQILELPSMKDIKSRQKEDGRIANVDKKFVIEQVKKAICSQGHMSQFKQVVDSRYVKVKMALCLGKGEKAFEQYLKYNTNISSAEILGKQKENNTEYKDKDVKDILNDFVRQKNEHDNKTKR